MQFGPVPGHIGVMPGEPGEQGAIGTDPGCGEEIGATDQHHRFGRLPVGMGADRHDLIGRSTLEIVPLAHAQHPSTIGGETQIRVPIPVLDIRCRREGDRGVRSLGQAVQTLIGPVGEHDIIAVQPPGTAAVLMHPGAGPEPIGQHIDVGPVRTLTDQLDAAALGGTSFAPPQPGGTDAEVADRHRPRDDQLRGDRRRPGAVRPGGHRRVTPPRRAVWRCGRCPR